MNINPNILTKVRSHGARVVVVTKYLSSEDLRQVWGDVGKYETIWGLGENRVKALKDKDLPREKVHFIGNIQSREIPDLVDHCSVVHSLSSLRHAHIFEGLLSEGGKGTMQFFIQINITRESQKNGVLPEDFPLFVEKIRTECPTIWNHTLGISALGCPHITKEAKANEFKQLKVLRDGFFPKGIISAGTSRDFKIALEEGVEVVRIGKAFWKK